VTSLYPDLYHCKNFAVQLDCSIKHFDMYTSGGFRGGKGGANASPFGG